MSDVVLYPIRGQVAQVNGKSEFIVYVPRADKYTYGTVKIGDGLLINGETGAVDFDRSEITILEIKKNGVKIDPVNKVVNITISKADVGLSQVDNTSDANKPVSILQEQRIQEIKNGLMDDIRNVQEDLSDYKLAVEGLFADAEESLDGKLLVINNTISSNKNAVDAELLRINNILKGKEQSLAYANYQEVVNVFNAAATNAYNVGQTIYVQSPNVPDLWVYSVENTHVDFAYVGDEEIIDTLSENGFVQFGYYKLAMMETKTIDVANAVTLNTVQTITADKTFSLPKTSVYITSDYLTLQHTYNSSSYNAIYGLSIDDGIKILEANTTYGTPKAWIELRQKNVYVQASTFKYSKSDYDPEYDVATTNDITTAVNTDTYDRLATTNKTLVGAINEINSKSSLSATTLQNLLGDSSTIVHNVSDNKVVLELDNSITNTLAKALVVPMSAPSKTELVAVNSNNSQTFIEIGEGLALDNGVLKATGGGQTEPSGTEVTVGGVIQSTWNADTKLDKQNSTGTTQLKYENGFAITTTNGDAFRYNGYEVATKYDIETNIISALNTEV